MTSVAETDRLVDSIKRLRRAEAVPAVAEDVAVVRADLEGRLGPTLSRSRAARNLGVSQTALDRWIKAGAVQTVMSPTGRVELPTQYVLELSEAIDGFADSETRHPLARVLRERREQAEQPGESGDSGGAKETSRPGTRDHTTAERRSLAYHQLIAARLSEPLVSEARRRLDALVSEGRIHPRYAEAWSDLLARPPAEIDRAIRAEDQDGRDLRQNSPFAGVLNEHERAQIIASVR